MQPIVRATEKPSIVVTNSGFPHPGIILRRAVLANYGSPFTTDSAGRVGCILFLRSRPTRSKE
jgi:hypothetical protein